MVSKRGIRNMGVLVKEEKYTIYVDLKSIMEERKVTKGYLARLSNWIE